MALSMGAEILTESEYRYLQQLVLFDLKTSSWVLTPSEIRKLGGALFCFAATDIFFYTTTERNPTMDEGVFVQNFGFKWRKNKKMGLSFNKSAAEQVVAFVKNSRLTWSYSLNIAQEFYMHFVVGENI